MAGEMFNAFETMRKIAERALSNQKKRPGDYVKDGLLICGKCGEPRQKVITLSNPSPDDPDRKSELLVTIHCRCDREREEQKQKEEQAQQDIKVIERLKKASLMDEKFASATFDSMQKNQYNDRSIKVCKRYVEKFDTMMENNQGLLLWGSVGTGKSFAASCIANALISRKVPVVMTSFVKLLEIIQSTQDQESELLARFNHAHLVIFDDLGAERSTDYALEKVYNIIDTRYRKKLPMILTTNLSMDQMKQEIDIRYSRIYDRIFEVCYPLQFSGPSWRKKEASRRFEDFERLITDESN